VLAKAPHTMRRLAKELSSSPRKLLLLKRGIGVLWYEGWRIFISVEGLTLSSL
jgi:hypothetical protein